MTTPAMSPSAGAIEYQRALEALRNGVPNRQAVAALGCSQQEAETQFLQRLDSVKEMALEDKQVHGLILAGDFGGGKSHTLDYLEHLALSRNFVCSRVVVSKETPLFDPSKVYLAAIDEAAVPGGKCEAIREIAARLKPGTREYGEFFDWANRPTSGLSKLFIATLLLHEKLHNDPELVDQIQNFWAGEPLAISRIRQGLKQIDCAKLYTLKSVKMRDLALQRFIFTARMMVAAGFEGWVLLIDEVELVGRYSLLQRGRSYAELARWMGRVEGDTYPGLTAVAAITEDFGLAVLQRKSDRDKVGPRMRAKQTDEYTALAGRAETGMRLIQREAHSLRKPDKEMLATTYERLKEMYAKAYGWEPPDIPSATAAMTRAMRSYVRRWVNDWDLRRLYPGAELSADEELTLTPSYEEDDSLEQGSEESDGDVPF